MRSVLRTGNLIYGATEGPMRFGAERPCNSIAQFTGSLCARPLVTPVLRVPAVAGYKRLMFLWEDVNGTKPCLFLS